MKRLTLKLKLTLLYTFFMLLVTCAALAILFSLSNRELLATVQDRLTHRVQNSADAVILRDNVPAVETDFYSVESDVYLSLYDETGYFLMGRIPHGFDSEPEIKDGQIVPAKEPVITCQCIRVPVLNGHTAAAFVKFKKHPDKEALIEKLVSFQGLPQTLGLPSAPGQFIQYLEEDDRPQVRLDVDFENGMGISIGRLREDTVYDWKFIGLSHNTVRGAAGGAILCAELLKAQGYIAKK